MTLANLIGITLEAVEPDARTIGRLLEAAQNSLADAQLPHLSNEGKFDLAYKAIMQVANAALQANGFRTLTSKPGHHLTMIQSLPVTIGLDSATMIVLDQMRKQRNVIDYSGDIISASLASDAVRHATELHAQVVTWLRAHRPDLLA